MKRPALLRLLCLLLPLLGGCVMLERAPADLTCDPALTGRWLPLSDDGTSQNPLGDDYAEVDAQCRVTLVDHKTTERPGFSALGFQIGDTRYLAITEAGMRELFKDRNQAKPSTLSESAVLPVRYHIVDEVLELELPNATLLQPLIQQDQIKAMEVATGYVLQGDEATLHALMSERPELFGSPTATQWGNSPGTLRLRRAGATP